MKNVMRVKSLLLLRPSSPTWSCLSFRSSSFQPKPKSLDQQSATAPEDSEESDLIRQSAPRTRIKSAQYDGSKSDVTSNDRLAWSRLVAIPRCSSTNEEGEGTETSSNRILSSVPSGSLQLQFPSPASTHASDPSFLTPVPTPRTAAAALPSTMTQPAAILREEADLAGAFESSAAADEAAPSQEGEEDEEELLQLEIEEEKENERRIKRRIASLFSLPLREEEESHSESLDQRLHQQKVKSIESIKDKSRDSSSIRSFSEEQQQTKRRSKRRKSMACEFGYHPEEWCKSYPIATNGTRQSPIDICSSGCKCVSSSNPESVIDLKYPESITDLVVKNTGHGWIVNIPPDAARNTCLTGGPLNGDKYILEQFHCHWGSNCSCGSEHTVDGKSYAAELHLVHWNSSKFASFSEAVSQDKGLAVVGVFLDTNGCTEPNPDLAKVTDRMKDIRYKNSTAPIDGPLVIQNLVPADKSFWTYEGSLTTPPLYESVTWLVLKNPIQVTEGQVAQFREICFNEETERPADGTDVPIVANFRPTQPIHERVISFIG